MADPIVLTPESLSLLYGESFFIHPGDVLKTAPKPEVRLEEPRIAKPTVAVQEPQQPSADAPKPRLEPVVEPRAQLVTKPGITWRTKPGSKVLFVLQLTEFKNPELTDLLKKIVDSLGIPPELVGFGQIDGPVDLAEFDQLPNPYAVVFDNGVWGGAENPVRFGKGEVFFSHHLADLQLDQDLKRQLWGHLKNLKEKLVSL
jgi:hypothetical protein